MDMFEREWQDILPHIEGSIREGEFEMTALEQTEQGLNFGDYVVTYSGKIGRVVSNPWTDIDNGEQIVVVEVDGKCHSEGTADLTIATVEDAWKELQGVPSYVEVQAKAWAAELGLEIA